MFVFVPQRKNPGYATASIYYKMAVTVQIFFVFVSENFIFHKLLPVILRKLYPIDKEVHSDLNCFSDIFIQLIVCFI